MALNRIALNKVSLKRMTVPGTGGGGAAEHPAEDAAAGGGVARAGIRRQRDGDGRAGRGGRAGSVRVHSDDRLRRRADGHDQWPSGSRNRLGYPPQHHDSKRHH